MSSSRSQRNPKAEAVLAALCDHLGSMMKTQAVKFPYLVDVVAVRVLGQPITDARHETWEHGVVCAPLFHMLEHEVEGSGFRVERSDYTESQSVRRQAAPVEPEERLDEQELAIVRYVADEYGDMPGEVLGRLTKRMNPDVPPSAWGNNRTAEANDDAYERLTTTYQEMATMIDGLNPRTLWENAQPLSGDPAQWV